MIKMPVLFPLAIIGNAMSPFIIIGANFTHDDDSSFKAAYRTNISNNHDDDSDSDINENPTTNEEEGDAVAADPMIRRRRTKHTLLQADFDDEVRNNEDEGGTAASENWRTVYLGEEKEEDNKQEKEEDNKEEKEEDKVEGTIGNEENANEEGPLDSLLALRPTPLSLHLSAGDGTSVGRGASREAISAKESSRSSTERTGVLVEDHLEQQRQVQRGKRNGSTKKDGHSGEEHVRDDESLESMGRPRAQETGSSSSSRRSSSSNSSSSRRSRRSSSRSSSGSAPKEESDASSGDSIIMSPGRPHARVNGRKKSKARMTFFVALNQSKQGQETISAKILGWLYYIRDWLLGVAIGTVSTTIIILQGLSLYMYITHVALWKPLYPSPGGDDLLSNGDFDESLCGCTRDKSVCVHTFIPCFLFTRITDTYIAARMFSQQTIVAIYLTLGMCIFWPFSAIFFMSCQRARLRQVLGAKSRMVTSYDVLVTTFCLCCSAAQEARSADRAVGARTDICWEVRALAENYERDVLGPPVILVHPPEDMSITPSPRMIIPYAVSTNEQDQEQDDLERRDSTGTSISSQRRRQL